MPRLAATIIAALAVAFLLLWAFPAQSACEWSWCTHAGPKTTNITDTRRTRVGDLYAPAPGRRVQIRDNRRNIIGYIEPSGRVTDTRRQEIGSIGNLYD